MFNNVKIYRKICFNFFTLFAWQHNMCYESGVSVCMCMRKREANYLVVIFGIDAAYVHMFMILCLCSRRCCLHMHFFEKRGRKVRFSAWLHKVREVLVQSRLTRNRSGRPHFSPSLSLSPSLITMREWSR